MRKPGIGCRHFDFQDTFGGKGCEMIAESLIDFGVFFRVIGCAVTNEIKHNNPPDFFKE